METDKERDVEEINNILNLAKLNESDVKSTSQLDSNLIKELEEGHVLHIKGDDDDEVVICSETQTFHVTSAETSNSLLLAKNVMYNDDMEDGVKRKINRVEVNGIFYEYLEAVLGKPYLKKLNELLKDSVYKGPEYEFEINKDKLYTFEQLNQMVQASPKELKEALESMSVVKINDKIRLLDFEYHFRVLSYMLKLIDENSWQLDEIDYEQTIDTLSDLVPREILSDLFDKYAVESQIVDGLQLYRYDEHKVCSFFAKVLLHDAGKFNLDDFLQAWRESVPEGMNPNEEMLYGIAIIDRKAQPNIIWALDESVLPENITERFKILFDVKEKWTVPEISPYVKSLTTEKVDVHALLAKYARASKMNGIKYYSAKHGK